MTTEIVLGELEGGARVQIDLPALLSTRLLIQGMSGSGKSRTIRRLLEQTHGKVQHFVIDREGEFASLRSHYDYVLIGRGGDKVARVDQAAALAESMLELQASVICDLSELRPRDRQAFVAYFLSGLLEADRNRRNPALVVIDEADVFCPQKARAESAAAVADLLSKGRKRGLCAVLATQRFAKLDKDAAAECGNYLIGRTRWPEDRARALDIMALGGAEAKRVDEVLPKLRPGRFYCAGDAFIPSELGVVQVGPVVTHHPQVTRGDMIAPAPPPSERVREVLSRLDQIEDEKAAEEAEIVRLRRRVSELEARPAAAPDPGQATRLAEEIAELRGQVTAAQEDVEEARRQARAGLDAAHSYQAALARIIAIVQEDLPTTEGLEDYFQTPYAPAPVRVPSVVRPVPPAAPAPPAPVRPAPVVNADLNDYQRRMLDTLVAHHPAVLTVVEWAMLAERSHKSSSWDSNLSALKQRGLVEVRGKEARPTEAALALYPNRPVPLSDRERLALYRKSLPSDGARAFLDALVSAGESSLTREELGAAAGYSPTSSSFDLFWGQLKRNELGERDGTRYRGTELVRRAGGAR